VLPNIENSRFGNSRFGLEILKNEVFGTSAFGIVIIKNSRFNLPKLYGN